MNRDEIAETVQEVLESMGFNVNNRLEMQKQMAAVREMADMLGDEQFKADLVHLRRWRTSVENATRLSFMTVVGVILSGLLGALWLGIKVMMK